MTDKSDIAELKTLIKSQSDILNDIHFAIYGNKKANVKGMGETLSDHAKYIANDKKFKWVAAGATVSGFGGVIAYIKTYLGL